MGNICNCCKKKEKGKQSELELDKNDVYAPPLSSSSSSDEESSPVTYTPHITKPPVRRSRRLAQKRMRKRGAVMDAVEAFMEPHLEL